MTTILNDGARIGRVGASYNTAALPPRVQRHIDKTESCWIWTGSLDRDGYGQIWAPEHGTRRAARAIYLWIRGPIPEGMVLDHLCRNRACVNPNHVEAVTQKVNVWRGDLKPVRKTHCPRGHEYAGSNLLEKKLPGGRVNRLCRTCVNANRRAARAA